jgi:hypothetical protein
MWMKDTDKIKMLFDISLMQLSAEKNLSDLKKRVEWLTRHVEALKCLRQYTERLEVHPAGKTEGA